MKMKKVLNKLLAILCFSLLFYSVSFATIINQKGDFSVQYDDKSLTKKVYNDNILTTISFTIKNNLVTSQRFNILVPRQSGWDISISKKEFILKPNEEKVLSVTFKANKNFDYSPDVISPSELKISKREDYSGRFSFPVLIRGEKEDVSFNSVINILKKEKKPEFEFRISSSKFLPKDILKYSILGKNLNKNPSVVEVELFFNSDKIDSKKLSMSYKEDGDYKILESKIPITTDPGNYMLNVNVKLIEENNKYSIWHFKKEIEILPYEKLDFKKEEKINFYSKNVYLRIENKGNTNSIFNETINVGFLNSFFFKITDKNRKEINYDIKNGVAKYSLLIKKGEQKEIVYTLNYLPLYVFLFVVLVLIIYMYIRINSNPLDVETKIYDIKRVENEGIKSLKVRIGFENIKENKIDDLKIIFRMPSYLNVKENSFLITPPNKVLKGKHQFKLEWDFKKFEKNDSRIIGFTLINSKGILGDIKIPDLEIEVKSRSKVKKYYASFPTIKG